MGLGGVWKISNESNFIRGLDAGSWREGLGLRVWKRTFLFIYL